MVTDGASQFGIGGTRPRTPPEGAALWTPAKGNAPPSPQPNGWIPKAAAFGGGSRGAKPPWRVSGPGAAYTELACAIGNHSTPLSTRRPLTASVSLRCRHETPAAANAFNGSSIPCHGGSAALAPERFQPNTGAFFRQPDRLLRAAHQIGEALAREADRIGTFHDHFGEDFLVHAAP